MIETVQAWGQQLEALHGHIGRHFHRAEPRRRALAYLQGVLSSCERKNGWQLAETIGDCSPDGVQRLLNAARWDADAVRDDLRTYVVEHLADPNAVLIIDETSFRKRGTKSVGVHHQYCGATGKLENCQVGVFLAYASSQGTAFIDRALFLPQAWAQDHRRRAEASVPNDVAFATKPALALAMLERAFDTGLVAGWVTADALYGCDRRLRRALEQRHQRYVVAIKSNELLPRDAFWRLSAKYVAEDFAAADWQRLAAGAGTKGPRWFDWAWQALPYATGGEDARGWGQWLLVRRNVDDPTDLTYYIVFAPRSTTTLAQVVTVAGMRWQIETGFETAKGDCGLADYEVRRWDAWYRHITLVLLAHAFLVVMRVQMLQKGAQRLTMASRLPCRRSAASFGSCSGRVRRRGPRCWPGHAGAADTNGMPGVATIDGAARCSDE
jgi:SRSO17 transposase